MRKFKRLTMTLALLITAVGGAWAQGPWTSGDCTVTLSNGTLTVSGKGAMANYDNNFDRPWHNNRNDITSVVVESGVTTAGQAAFYHFENLTSVTLPEGLTRIGVDAFRYCNNLTSITIPSTVTSIGADAFNCLDGSSKMTDVYLYPDPANLTWVDGDCNDFKGDKATQCHVLAEHLSAYQTKFNGKVNVTFVGDLEPLPTPLTVEWDPATKTGTFKMPASDVLLQVEYEPTKVTMATNDNTMGTVEVSGESKVEWTPTTWSGWSSGQNTEMTKSDGGITMTYTNTPDHTYDGSIKENETSHALDFFINEYIDDCTVTFSSDEGNISRIELSMTEEYFENTIPNTTITYGNPHILPLDGWTFEGKSAVWEGEATKSLTLKSCSTTVSKITFFKGDIPDGVTVNTDGTFTVAKTATVTLTATPAEGYKFKCWEDDPTNTNPVREVTIESGLADMTYKAVFEEILYNVTFADGIEDADEWKAEPNAAAKNTEIKVTYSGAKKVIDVKVEKKADNPNATAKLGDLFYSDGTFSTELEAGKTPIGVIAYLDKEGTDDDEISEKSNGAGHGLVLCLKNAASNVAWSTNISSQAYTGNAFVTDVAGLKRSEGVSGYSATAALATDATTYPAAAAAKNYTGLTAPTSTTGWFLPSAQQLVKMIEGLGGLDDGAPNIGSYFDNNHEGADKWENAIKKAGDGKYDSMTSDYLLYWSSSENSVGYAVFLAVDARSTGTSRGFSWLNYGKDQMATMILVRPILAF